jgi:transglutaminase-like putative cysteine protease
MPTHYAIRHVTRFAYSSPVSESVMELRMQPRSEGRQRCLQFDLVVEPRARVFGYRDCVNNWVHHFDIPRRHEQLAITSRAVVQMEKPPALPASLDPSAWSVVDAWAANDEYWELRQPSRFAEYSEALVGYARGRGFEGARLADPLTTVRSVMAAIYRDFEYDPTATQVDSPIDDALAAGRGVCQDFAHLMLAMLRRLGLPARYVSGYLAPLPEAMPDDRPSTVATHAWVEVQLPGIGWVGVDPTHDCEAGLRHVCVAVGRDYADVPPTRGVLKGQAASTLSVTVQVAPRDALLADPPPAEAAWVAETPAPVADPGQERERQLQLLLQQHQQQQ